MTAVVGGGGADFIFGFAGADVLSGAAGDDKIQGGADNDTLTEGDGTDTIDGGAVTDTTVFSGGRDDYRIWMVAAGGGDPARFHMHHEESDADMSNDRDTLTNVEMIRFDDAETVELDAALAANNKAIAVAGTAPATRTDDVPAGTIV